MTAVRAQLDALRFHVTRLHEAVDLTALIPETGGIAWLRGGDGFVGWGEALRVDPGTGPQRYARAADALSGVLSNAEVEGEKDAPVPIAFGSFTFDPTAPGSALVVPKVLVARRGAQAWLIAEGEAQAPALRPALLEYPPATVRLKENGNEDARWLDGVRSAIDSIAEGTLEKVVLARRLTATGLGAIGAGKVARALSRAYPECFTYLIDGFVGATPELLVSREGRHLRSVVMAGSRPRGADEVSDAALEKALYGSLKDRFEHDLSVKSVVEALEGCCSEIRVDAEPSVFRMANVQHLTSEVRGRLNAPMGALDVAGLLHPTAAVCGWPRDEALQAIRHLETFDRGRYAGPVGWVDAGGDGEWGIALRCADVEGDTATIFAGSGIVSGSDPEMELEETRIKFEAILGALNSNRG